MSSSLNAVESNDWDWRRLKKELNELSGQKKATCGIGANDGSIINGNGSANNSSARIGIALIGLGRIGSVHLRNLLREPKAKLLYCLDSDSDRLEDLSDSPMFVELAIKTLHSSRFKEALADPEVQAVVVAAPSVFHEPLTRTALEAGKSVMCEKPLTLDSKQVAPLYELAKQRGVFLLSAFNRRYDPEFRCLHDKIEQLGHLHLVRTSSRDSQTPSLDYVHASGDILHDSAIHDFDLILWYTRQLPSRVQVMGKSWKKFYEQNPHLARQLSPRERSLLEQINDLYFAAVTLTFPNGCIGQVDISRQCNYGYDQRCEVFGLNGMLKCGDGQPLNTVEYTANGIIRPTLGYTFASRYNVAYANEIRDLISMAQLASNRNFLHEDKRLIRERLLEPMRPSLIIASIKVADAAIEAWKLGASVDMDWSEEFKSQFAADLE